MVVGLAHIELSHEAFIRAIFSTLEIVHQLMGYKDVVVDHTVRSEGTLALTDALGKKNF